MNFSKVKNWYLTRVWKKQHKIDSTLQTIEDIFKNSNGFVISAVARENYPSLELTYGEIQIESFLALLTMAKPSANQTFYDLGCGIGKTVWAAALTFPFQNCIGIEKILELHLVNLRTLGLKSEKIQFYHQDILETKWLPQSILYLNVASFIPESWHKIEKKLILEPADIVFTLAKPLSEKYFHIHSTQVMTTWGIVPAYLHYRKINS